jgi:hypothetical protein
MTWFFLRRWTRFARSTRKITIATGTGRESLSRISWTRGRPAPEFEIRQCRSATARRSELQPGVLDDWIDNCSYGLSEETTQSEDFETQATQAHEGEPA